MKPVGVLLAAAFSASLQTAAIRLPAGVTGVSFGQAQRYRAGGKEMCTIAEPLRTPAAFARGVVEIAYAVHLEPLVVKSASARVVAPAGQELRAAPCNALTPVKGGFSQTQLGSSITRLDKAPLLPGQYTLRITVDGQVAEVPFTIR
jgi:hypothetical protein